MSYPKKLLNPGEQVFVDVVPHWKFLVGPVLFVLIVLAGAITALQFEPPRWAELAIAGVMALALLWLLGRYLRWVTTSLVVTNQRLIMRKGIVRRSGREILIGRLTDISYKQSLTDRVLRCGDILLESAGRDGQEVLPDLPHPVKIQNEVARLVSERDRVPGASGVGQWPLPPSFGPGPGGAPAPTGGTTFGPPGAEPARPYPSAGDPTAGTPSEPVMTVAEQLSQLDELRRRGVISRREFAAKKSEILSRM